MLCLAELSPGWSDFYTIGGFWGGLIGLGIAIFQIRQAKRQAKSAQTAAEAAKEAAERTGAETRRNVRWFIAGNVARLLDDVQRLVDNEDWVLGPIRASDLAESIEQLPGRDAELDQVVDAVRKCQRWMVVKRARVKARFPASDFQAAVAKLRRRLKELRDPFGGEA